MTVVSHASRSRDDIARGNSNGNNRINKNNNNNSHRNNNNHNNDNDYRNANSEPPGIAADQIVSFVAVSKLFILLLLTCNNFSYHYFWFKVLLVVLSR
jgi:hypothetical protein